MNVRPKLPLDEQMTIEEFLAFADTRPDEERWELIEGTPVLNPSPIDFHQIIVTNIVVFLMNDKTVSGASWLPLIGTGTRVPASVHSLPQPDVLVKEHAATGSPVTGDALVIFEILSKSNTKAEIKGAAACMPACLIASITPRSRSKPLGSKPSTEPPGGKSGGSRRSMIASNWRPSACHYHCAQSAIRAARAHLIFLPPYSPDLNPIEQVFATLKSLLRKAQERTVENVWKRIGSLLSEFQPTECANYLRNSGYASM